MTRYSLTTSALSLMLALSPMNPVLGQGVLAQPASDRFDSENAILDTALPFAIGAREAEQALRGSFGWPTFQEGLVEGVYFRFDPDGYARFSTSPRLDTDVFEVICRPRTYACTARKGPLSMHLDARGRLQLKLEQITAGDMLFLVEGANEIPLPERILQPLDTRLEALLAAGGDLVQRRSGNEVVSVSLSGFVAVGAYLRWVMARQDYTILPRGWPVPNSRSEGGAITQAGSWNSPMPQPQRVAVADVEAGASISEPQAVVSNDLAGEIERLRQELVQPGAVPVKEAVVSGIDGRDLDSAERLARLELNVEYLSRDMAILKEQVSIGLANPGHLTDTAPVAQDETQRPVNSNPAAATVSEPETATEVLANVAARFGLPADTDPNILLVLLKNTDKAVSTAPLESDSLLRDGMVASILDGIELSGDEAAPAPFPNQDYVALAEYLGRVMSQK